jgi:hypothetical protein
MDQFYGWRPPILKEDDFKAASVGGLHAKLKKTCLLVRRTRVARGTMADLSLFSIVTYERKRGYWRAAITPIRRSSTVVQGKTTTSIVTPNDFSSETDAKFAAEKMIRKM